MRKATKATTVSTLVSSLCLIALAACGSGGNSSGSASDEPIRIALATPLAGPFAVYGKQEQAGVEFAAKEVNANGGVDGRKVEIYTADTGGTPAGAVSAVERLVQQKKAKFVIGTVATPVTLAVMQRLQSLDAIQFGTQSNGDDLTGKSCVSRFFRTNGNETMTIGATAQWLKSRPERRWDIIASDYSYGHEVAENMQTSIEALGGSVGKVLYPPLGTTDFAPYISSLGGGDGLFVNETGSDGANFYQQALSFGLLGKYKTTLGGIGSIDSTRLGALGTKLSGQWTAFLWHSTVETPESKTFVSNYRKSTGSDPGDFVGQAYVGMQTIFAGVRKAKSVDPATVAKSLEGLPIDTLHGTLTMRGADHQLMVPIYVGQVTTVDGEAVVKATQTVPASRTMPKPDPACNLS